MMIMRDKGCMWSTVGYYLVLVGAINWGIVGLGMFFKMNWNIVTILFGTWPMLVAVVYLIIGIAGVMTLVGCRCKTCTACHAEADAGVKQPEQKM